MASCQVSIRWLFDPLVPGAFFQRYTTVSGLDGKLKYETLGYSDFQLASEMEFCMNMNPPNTTQAGVSSFKRLAFDFGSSLTLLTAQTHHFESQTKSESFLVAHLISHFPCSKSILILMNLFETPRKGTAISDFQQHSRQKRPCHADLIVLDPESGGTGDSHSSTTWHVA